jgi:hypothetical protein
MDSCNGHDSEEVMTYTDQIELWNAINDYTESCNGNTGTKTVSINRMNCVVKVNKIIEDIIEKRISRKLEFQKRLRQFS